MTCVSGVTQWLVCQEWCNDSCVGSDTVTRVSGQDDFWCWQQAGACSLVTPIKCGCSVWSCWDPYSQCPIRLFGFRSVTITLIALWRPISFLTYKACKEVLNSAHEVRHWWGSKRACSRSTHTPSKLHVGPTPPTPWSEAGRLVLEADTSPLDTTPPTGDCVLWQNSTYGMIWSVTRHCLDSPRSRVHLSRLGPPSHRVVLLTRNSTLPPWLSNSELSCQVNTSCCTTIAARCIARCELIRLFIDSVFRKIT